MKKLLIALLAGAFLLMASVPGYAGTRKKIIDSVTLDDSPTSIISDVVNVDQADSVGLFLDVDETEVGNSISVAITLEASYDGTTWISASFFDFSGGPASFQTSETISADGSYIFWTHADSNLSRLRVTATATNSDVDDIVVIDCWAVVK